MRVIQIYGKLNMDFRTSWHWKIGMLHNYTYDPDPSPTLIDWHAPITDVDIAHIEALAAKYDDPHTPPTDTRKDTRKDSP